MWNGLQVLTLKMMKKPKLHWRDWLSWTATVRQTETEIKDQEIGPSTL